MKRKYKLVIELDDERYLCLQCPACDANDNCALQQDLEPTETWQEQMMRCPLELESEGE